MKLSAEFNNRTRIDRVGADIAITHGRTGNPERQRHAAAIDHPIKDACRHVSDGEHLLSRKESSQSHTSMYAISYICHIIHMLRRLARSAGRRLHRPKFSKAPRKTGLPKPMKGLPVRVSLEKARIMRSSVSQPISRKKRSDCDARRWGPHPLRRPRHLSRASLRGPGSLFKA